MEDAAQVAHEEYQSSKDVATPGTWAFVRVHGKGRIKAIEVANQVTLSQGHQVRPRNHRRLNWKKKAGAREAEK